MMRASDFVAVERGAPEVSYAGLGREHAAPEPGVQTRHDLLHAPLRLCGFDVPAHYGELQLCDAKCWAGCVSFCAPARPMFFPPDSRELHVLGVRSLLKVDCSGSLSRHLHLLLLMCYSPGWCSTGWG
jgi:hypothetical protein